mgnify:CR=1 FL=1
MYSVWVSWHDMFCIFLEPKQLQRSHVMWFFSEALYRWHGTYAFFCFFTLQMTWEFAFFGYVRHAGSIATASLRLSSREHISLRCTEVASPLSVQMFAANKIVDDGESFTLVCWSANHINTSELEQHWKHKHVHAAVRSLSTEWHIRRTVMLGTSTFVWELEKRHGSAHDWIPKHDPETHRRSGREAQASHFTCSKLIQHHNQQSSDGSNG